MADKPHLNQPEGRFRPSLHPNIQDRERELRSLTDAVRRLIEFNVTHEASAEQTAQTARELHQLADRLETQIPSQPPARYGPMPEPSEPHDHFLYDPVLGLYNPMALPVQMRWEPPRAIGEAKFTTPFEGPPGCVHGAVLAGVFDQVFNVANLMTGSAGPTAELVLTYRRPTPLHRKVVFDAQVESIEGRKIRTLGHARYEGEVTVEARGLFILFEPGGIDELTRRMEGALAIPGDETVE
ncbi:PaaI family thioesterase [Myxococcota bacterium]|nr:PaaI family thioesterase [Myxococcota bacterium]